MPHLHRCWEALGTVPAKRVVGNTSLFSFVSCLFVAVLNGNVLSLKLRCADFLQRARAGSTCGSVFQLVNKIDSCRCLQAKEHQKITKDFCSVLTVPNPLCPRSELYNR